MKKRSGFVKSYHLNAKMGLNDTPESIIVRGGLSLATYTRGLILDVGRYVLQIKFLPLINKKYSYSKNSNHLNWGQKCDQGARFIKITS